MRKSMDRMRGNMKDKNSDQSGHRLRGRANLAILATENRHQASGVGALGRTSVSVSGPVPQKDSLSKMGHAVSSTAGAIGAAVQVRVPDEA
mgnify:CR=1 FL=1